MTVKLTDEQWQKILPVLNTIPDIRLGAGRDVRRFLEAIFAPARNGGSCRASMTTGTRSINASRAGANSRSLRSCSSISRKTAIWNIC